MAEDHGGGTVRGDRLAPVIPLFGGDAPHARRSAAGRADGRGVDSQGDSQADSQGGTGGSAAQGAGNASLGTDGDDSDVAADRRSDQWHRSWIVEHQPAVAGVRDEGGDDDAGDDRGAVRVAAETVLLKKLRSRSLSEREARGVLAAQELETHEIDSVIDSFLGHGYLDDARLAEQLVHVATDRKAQGRQSVAQTLVARGIPRDVVAATLAELPDDDAERALAFARQKARSMASLDRDTALRRLHGQLARRGFGGPTAMSAARQALDESGSRPSSVRFR